MWEKSIFIFIFLQQQFLFGAFFETIKFRFYDIHILRFPLTGNTCLYLRKEQCRLKYLTHFEYKLGNSQTPVIFHDDNLPRVLKAFGRLSFQLPEGIF